MSKMMAPELPMRRETNGRGKEWLEKVMDFPDAPVVKTLAPKPGGAGLIPGRGPKILHVWEPKQKHKTEVIL